MTHFVALLVARFSRPGQNVYWISDEDELFGGATRQKDLLSMLGMWMGMHSPHPLGELGAGTTVIDPGDRFEEDLASIPDLTAGATREYVNASARAAGINRLPTGIALTLPSPLTQKTETILDWMAERSALSHLIVLIDSATDGRYSISQIQVPI